MSEETTHSVVEKKNNPYLIPGSILVAGVFIALSIAFSHNVSSTDTKGNTDLAAASVEIREGDHIYGPKDAEVFLIEYSDYRCGYCGRFHETIQSILNSDEYKGKVAWVYRHTPYQPGGKEVAIASECVAELAGEDAFWKYTDEVFKNQQSLNSEWSKKEALALGVNESEYDTCITSGKYDSLIADTSFEAQQLGGEGTPYNVLLTKKGGVIKFSGAQSFENVKIFINRALNSLK